MELLNICYLYQNQHMQKQYYIKAIYEKSKLINFHIYSFIYKVKYVYIYYKGIWHKCDIIRYNLIYSIAKIELV